MVEKEIKIVAKGKISSFLFFFKIILVFIYNLVCIGVAVFPLLIFQWIFIPLIFFLAFVLTMEFSINTVSKNQKIIIFLAKFFIVLMVIPVCLIIWRFFYFINKALFIIFFIVFLITYIYRLLFLKKIFFPLIFPAILTVLCFVNFYLFWQNRDNSRYEKILSNRYVKPILIFNKNYSKNCIYLVNAGAARRLLTDDKEKYLFVTLQSPPLNSYTLVRLNFNTWSGLKVLFGEITLNITIHKNKIYIPIYEESYKPGYCLVLDINSFKIIKKFFSKYGYLMHVLINNKKNNLFLISEKHYSQIYDLKSFNEKGNFILDVTPHSILLSDDKKMYVGTIANMFSIIEVSLKNFHTTKKMIGPFWGIMGLAENKKAKLIYAVEILWGNLKIITLPKFIIVREIPLKTGIRTVAYDTKRNVIYVGNFITGDFYIIDANNFNILGEIYIGDKIRCIYITPKTNKILVANVYGVFEIKVDELIKKNNL